MNDTDARPKALIIGPVPPPVYGVAQATKLMVESPVLASRLNVIHLDTSDVVGFKNMGRLDLHNVWLGLRHVGGLIRLLAKRSPDVVLLTASQSKFALVRDAAFVALARASGARVVTYLRASGYDKLSDRQGWYAARMLRYMLKHSSRVLVLGGDLVGMAHAVCPESTVVVVPNGCPPAVPPNNVGVRDGDHPVVAYIGRLSHAKGFEDALSAFQSVATVPKLEFLLCGEWDSLEYEAQARPLIEKHGLTSVVTLPGPVTGQAKQDVLSRAWVLVVPSHSEGQPWVILEAMSAGVPVVATHTGAIPETIADGVSGFVVPVGDPGALAGRVLELLEDDGLWKKMARESFERYQERFTVARSHAALADELCEVASESNTSAQDRKD